MPVHIKNNLIFEGEPEHLQQMFASISLDTSDEVPDGIQSIDFNKIVPMPSNLYQGAIGEREKAIYGQNNWYDWCHKNWGTKWNSYGYREDTPNPDAVISFNTANGIPHPVIQKLSELYPDIGITHQWASDDLGIDCGERKYLEGKVLSEIIPQANKEAIEFACQVRGTTPRQEDRILNADESDYIGINFDEYALITVFDKPALFANERLSEADIPKGLYLYHTRSTDDGSEPFCTIEPYVGVNHTGSIVTNEPIDFGDQKGIRFTEDTSPNFLGEDITFEQFIDGDYDIDIDEGIGELS